MQTFQIDKDLFLTQKKTQAKGYNMDLSFFVTKVVNRIADHLAKRFKFDAPYFMRAGFWTGASVAISTLWGFVFSLLLIRHLDTVTLGKWYWILSAAGILSLLTFDGVANVCTHHMIKKKFDAYFWGLKIRVYGGVFASLGVLILSALLATQQHNFVFLLVLIGYFPLIGFVNSGRYLYVKNRFRQQFFLLLLRTTLYYGVTVLLLIHHASFVVILISFFYLQVLPDVIIFYVLGKEVKKEKKVKLHSASFIKKSVSQSILQAFPLASNYIDRLIIPFMLSLGDLAAYGVIFLLPLAIRSLIYRLTFPLFFKKFNETTSPKRTLYRSSLALIIFLIGLTAVVSVFLPFVFEWVVTETYASYLPLAQIAVLFISINILADHLLYFFYYTLHAKAIMFTGLGSLVSYVVALFALLGGFGLLGAILARAIYDVVRILIASYFVVNLKSTTR